MHASSFSQGRNCNPACSRSVLASNLVYMLELDIFGSESGPV
jgi:hypothetical protein